MEKKKYFKNLDATRFIAFLAVFSEHVFVSVNGENLNEGLFQQTSSYVKSFSFLGLEYFFVLSSFLITWLALEEYKHTEKFKAVKFIARRALRVFPLYFLIVAIAYIGVLIIQLCGDVSINSLPSFIYFLTFTVNFYTIDHGTEYLFFLVFLWSISIEEQFYVFWAFALRFFIKYLKYISLALIVISILFRSYYTFFEHKENVIFFHTFSVFGNFGVGALVAIFCFNKGRLFDKLKFIPSGINIIVYLSFFGLIFLYNNFFSSSISQVLERLIFSCFFGYIILEQSYNNNSLFKFGRILGFTYLGKISYGLYCFHGLIITVLIKGLKFFSYEESLIDSLVFYPIIVFVLTVLVSSISYRFYEGWFLKQKKRFNTY